MKPICFKVKFLTAFDLQGQFCRFIVGSRSYYNGQTLNFQKVNTVGAKFLLTSRLHGTWKLPRVVPLWLRHKDLVTFLLLISSVIYTLRVLARKVRATGIHAFIFLFVKLALKVICETPLFKLWLLVIGLSMYEA